MTDIETLRWTAEHLLPLQQADWLTKAMEILRKDFQRIGETFPDSIDIVFDFYPYSGNMGILWMGCYSDSYSDSHCVRKGGKPVTSHPQIHINPTLTSLCALDILVHELVHAATPENLGHSKRFREVAAAIGMDDKGTASGAEEVLLKRLVEIRNILGPFPLVTDCVR